MGRNYYCDYCDKRMKNDIQIRKKHLEGMPHKNARNEYYAKFKGILSNPTPGKNSSNIASK